MILAPDDYYEDERDDDVSNPPKWLGVLLLALVLAVALAVWCVLGR